MKREWHVVLEDNTDGTGFLSFPEIGRDIQLCEVSRKELEEIADAVREGVLDLFWKSEAKVTEIQSTDEKHEVFS
jgi:hypothetical protein